MSDTTQAIIDTPKIHLPNVKGNDISSVPSSHTDISSLFPPQTSVVSLENSKNIVNEPDILKKEETQINSVNKDNELPFIDQHDDSGSVLVIILQCETKSCDNNINNLKWVFSDPYFILQVCAVDNPPNIPISKTLTQSQYLENYYMRKALTYASEGPYVFNQDNTIEPQHWWSDIPCIIIKDSSVSNITPIGNTKLSHSSSDDNIISGMKHRIQVALERAQKADLFFLCKWNDACNKYVDVTNPPASTVETSLKWSIQPTSTQAVMYTPSTRDYIRQSLITSNITLSDLLNTNISQGNLLATVFVPNLIDFDIDLATSNDDYQKLNECAPSPSTTTQSNTTSSIIWLVIIIIAVILVAWFLIQLRPQ